MFHQTVWRFTKQVHSREAKGSCYSEIKKSAKVKLQFGVFFNQLFWAPYHAVRFYSSARFHHGRCCETQAWFCCINRNAALTHYCYDTPLIDFSAYWPPKWANTYDFARPTD